MSLNNTTIKWNNEFAKLPKLTENQYFRVSRYLLGNNMRTCPSNLEAFKEVTFLGESSGFYHFLCEKKFIVTATIVNK